MRKSLNEKPLGEKKMFEIMVIYMYIGTGQGQTTPWVISFFKKHKCLVNLLISCKFFPIELLCNGDSHSNVQETNFDHAIK